VFICSIIEPPPQKHNKGSYPSPVSPKGEKPKLPRNEVLLWRGNCFDGNMTIGGYGLSMWGEVRGWVEGGLLEEVSGREGIHLLPPNQMTRQY
jgi:hypothetical protein